MDTSSNLKQRCYRFGLLIIQLCDTLPQKRSVASNEKISPLIQECEELAKMLGKSVLTLKKK